MKKSTLSVTIPNYNHGHYIGEALDAILSQSFKPLEILVLDDGSTDNSVEVIQGYEDRDPTVRLIRNEKNMGGAYCANKLLDLAKGDYIYAGASDDTILPGFFEKTMDLLSQYPDAGLCCSPFYILENGKRIHSRYTLRLKGGKGYLSPDELAERLKKGYFHIAGYTAIIKRDDLMRAGGFIPEFKGSCDGFALHTVGFRKGLCYINEPFAVVRSLSESYSSHDMRTQYEIINAVLNRLKEPEYRDVLPLYKKSKAFSVSGLHMLNVALKHPEHRDFMNMRVLKFMLKGLVASVSPSFIKRIYRRLFNK